MTRTEKLEAIVKLFSKAMFYGDWEWETPNERVIEMLMKEVGYYPYKDEDDMIAKSKIFDNYKEDDELYKRAIKEVPGRYDPNQQVDDEKCSEQKGVEK